MTAQLDHLILAVNDLDASLAFYRDVLGLEPDGEDGPFTVVRVTPDFVLLVAPWGTEGGEHLAFSMSSEEFDAVFARARAAGVPFGDDPHAPDNGQGPGEETGARGMGPTLYLLDPSKHLIEIRHYRT
jgi:catechol 2,3-dioxygenase-like lactoylglutathione lyase family enzyme